MIVLDDLGFGQLGCFGSDIATPNIDGLAAAGLAYNRFHVTAICSPTRACLLTGRNHHAVGMGFLTDIPMAYPGYTSRIPKSAATLPRLLRDAGYNTMAVGKWHLVPSGERSHAGPFDRWPLGFGFERYYGFLQGDTNHWSPNLVCDNHYVDPPATPADGYHLTEDLADTAIRFVQDQKHAAPDRPFFLYFALGAHARAAPRHAGVGRAVPRAFDAGGSGGASEVFARQLERGIVPAGTELRPRPSWVQDWDSLRPTSSACSRLPGGVRRLPHAHRRADRASARASSTRSACSTTRRHACLRQRRQRRGRHARARSTSTASRCNSPTPSRTTSRVSTNSAAFRSYNHYPWGWAWAGNTPLRLWKRYTWLGGTRTPLIVHWPRGIRARGEVRDQFVHVVDLMPTILDACGVEAPAAVDGVTQQPIDGASIRPRSTDADAPRPSDVQYFEMLGSRSIVHRRLEGDHRPRVEGRRRRGAPARGQPRLRHGPWALFRLADDFAEAHDVADEHPDVLLALQDCGSSRPGRNNVFPIVDEVVQPSSGDDGATEPAGVERRVPAAGGPVPDDAMPRLFGGFRLSPRDVAVPDAGAEGVLAAMGDWNNGFAFYVHDGRLVFALNRAGDVCRVAGTVPVPAGRHTFTCHYTIDATGPAMTLSHDDDVVASETMSVPVPMFWQHGGTALCLGYDRGFPVCDDYAVPFTFTGEVHQVVVEVGRQMPVDPGLEIRAALTEE